MTAWHEFSPYLTTFQPRENPRVRLVCFAHAGGSATTFAAWPRSLPSAIEVTAVQLPGREPRRVEEPLTDFDTLTRELAEALAELPPLPFAFFGYSLGGLIAFECARRLRAMAAKSPTQLIVGASVPPQLRRPTALKLGQLPQEQFIAEMVRRYDGIPAPILASKELLDYFVPTLQADVRLLESYRYREDAPLELPVRALGGDQDPHASASAIETWAQHTQGGQFTLKMFSGGHFFINHHRDAVLTEVARWLEHRTD